MTVEGGRTPLKPPTPLMTTTVGSFGKPEYLTKARGQHARGKLGATELEDLERKATAEWIRRQEDIGLDVLVDGEMYRGDMVAYFAERLEGFKLGGLVRSYGNRYYHKPVIAGKVQRPQPMTVSWFEYAQSLTTKPVKGMLTGPYTLLDWSYNEAYPTRRDAVLALAEVVRDEARDLERAGAKYIQIRALREDDLAHLLRGLCGDLPAGARPARRSAGPRDG